jgi:hypothetical protein
LVESFVNFAHHSVEALVEIESPIALAGGDGINPRVDSVLELFFDLIEFGFGVAHLARPVA